MHADPGPLVGRRVALRHRVLAPDGRPVVTDAVGELARDGSGWLVRTRRGPVAVTPAAVVAVRAVPPARPERAPLGAIAELERACARAWRAPVTSPVGDWLLRAADGFTGRANSALVVGDPGRPVPAALDVVREFAAAHGLPPMAQVPAGTPWEAAVQRAGWVPVPEHVDGAVSVRVLALSAPLAASGAEVLDAPVDGWWRLVAGTDRPTAAQVAVLTGADAVGYGVARLGGEVAGAVRAGLAGPDVLLARLAVDPAHRRRGLGRALSTAALAWARARGARRAALQVSHRNAAADRLYAALGFREHHRYRYWTPPLR